MAGSGPWVCAGTGLRRHARAVLVGGRRSSSRRRAGRMKKRFISWLFSTPRGLLCLAGGVLVVALGWYFGTPLRGLVMAHIDYALGHYRVWEGGPPAPWLREEQELLRERYGVEVDGVMPYLLTPWTFPYFWYGRGYNAAALDLLRQRYGKDVLDECYRDAKERWLAEHPEQRKWFGGGPQ